MRPIDCLLISLLLAPVGVAAQEVVVGGWVHRVDTRDSTLTLRTLGNARTVQVSPDAVIRVNGTLTRLDRLPLHSQVTVLAQKGAYGVLRATQITASASAGASPAAYPPGSIVSGRLVGINAPLSQIILRTPAGEFPVTVGTALITSGRRNLSFADLRIGQTVRVERVLPTAASTEYITQAVHVLSTPAVRVRRQATGPSAGRRATGTAAGSNQTEKRDR